MLTKCFTSSDMTQAFLEVCEFEFHPTNVGKFFKENDIPPIGKTKEGNNLYDGSHWELLFKHLYNKAINRCSLIDAHMNLI